MKFTSHIRLVTCTYIVKPFRIAYVLLKRKEKQKAVVRTPALGDGAENKHSITEWGIFAETIKLQI